MLCHHPMMSHCKAPLWKDHFVRFSDKIGMEEYCYQPLILLTCTCQFFLQILNFVEMYFKKLKRIINGFELTCSNNHEEAILL